MDIAISMYLLRLYNIETNQFQIAQLTLSLVPNVTLRTKLNSEQSFSMWKGSIIKI